VLNPPETPIYLDYNATTPVDEVVLEEMLPYFSEKFGNAASAIHAFGWVAAKAVDTARAQVAEALATEAQEIYFTSGATEAINTCLKGTAALYAAKKNRLVTVETEHKAVLDVCAGLERKGVQVTYLPVGSQGSIDLDQLRTAITEQTFMVCIMMANNETGLIHPMQEIAEIVHEKGALLMSDATQAVGKIPVNVQELGIDLLVMSAHKFYGPKGVGAMYLRRRKPRVRLMPLLEGGGHERGIRSGTLNVPGIVGLGKALERSLALMEAEAQRLQGLRDAFEEKLLQLSDVYRN